MTERQPQTQPDGEAPTVPIGTGMPTKEIPFNLPVQLWEIHTLESWARTVLNEVLLDMVRFPQPAPGVEAPLEWPFKIGHSHMTVDFYAMALPDGQVGVSASFSPPAPGGHKAYVHHLVKLQGLTPPPGGQPGQSAGTDRA